MKKSDLEALRKMERSGLLKKAAELKAQISDMVMDKHMGKLADKKAILKKRHERAAVLTVLTQKQMLENLEVSAEGEKL